MRGTLRMPKAMVTASKLRSANGSASALPSAKVDASSSPLRAGALAADREHVGIDVADRRPRARAAGLDHAEGDVAGAAGDIEQRERPRVSGGLTTVTSASFQARCSPPDIRSFIRS